MPPKRKAARGKVLSLSRSLSPESIFNYASLAERARAAPERNDKILTHLEKGGLKLNLLFAPRALFSFALCCEIL
jgi:hypothetical protein